MVYSSAPSAASCSTMSQDKHKFGTTTHVIRVVHVFSPTLTVTCSNPSHFPSLVQLLTGNNDSTHQVDGINGHPLLQDFNSIDCAHSNGHLVAGHSSVIGHSYQFPLQLNDELDTTPQQNWRIHELVDLTPHKLDGPIHANDASCKANHTAAQDGLVDYGLHNDINVQSIEDIDSCYYDQHSFSLDALHEYDDDDLHIVRSKDDVNHEFSNCRFDDALYNSSTLPIFHDDYILQELHGNCGVPS